MATDGGIWVAAGATAEFDGAKQRVLERFQISKKQFSKAVDIIKVHREMGSFVGYGQTQTPLIAYLSIDTTHEKIRGDFRFLEILTEKEEEAAKNIGDPLSLMGLYDEEEEIKRVARAIESNESPTEFESALQPKHEGLDWLDELMAPGAAAPPPVPTRQPLSLFKDDYDYVCHAFEWLNQSHAFPTAPRANAAHSTIQIRPDEDLGRFLERELDDEMWTDDRTFELCADRKSVKDAIARSRDTSRWPVRDFLDWTRLISCY